MDIVSMVFAQLFFLLVVGAICGIVWFAYQANLQQQQKASRGPRGSERKERDRKQPKASRQAAPVPEPEPENEEEESEAEAEPEPEPEPEPVAKKKNKKKAPAEEKKSAPEKKPQAKAAPVQAAPAKKAAQKTSSAPTQKAPAAPAKKVVEEKKEAKTEQKGKKDKTDKKKKLQEQQAEFEASLAALKRGAAPKTPDESGWTKTVSKSAKRSANKEEVKQSATSISLSIKARQYPIIIGPEGVTLKAITAHSGAEVNIEKSNRKELQPDVPIIVSIKGNAQNCAVAEALIKELLAEGFTAVTHPGFMSSSYKLKTPDRDRALLVGPKGANIRKLQDGCSVRIHLPVNRESNEISIIGTEQCCKKAAEAIDTLLREGYSTMTHEDFVRGEVEGVAPSQFAAIIGKKGENIARIQKETNTRITVPNKENDLVNVTIYGKEAGVNRARELILEALSKDSATPVVESNDPNDPWAAVNVSASEDW